jgi:hypothetical protein
MLILFYRQFVCVNVLYVSGFSFKVPMECLEIDESKMQILATEADTSIFTSQSTVAPCPLVVPENWITGRDLQQLEFTNLVHNSTVLKSNCCCVNCYRAGDKCGGLFKGLYNEKVVFIRVLEESSNYSREDFKKEYALLNSLRSSHIVKIYGASLDIRVSSFIHFSDTVIDPRL